MVRINARPRSRFAFRNNAYQGGLLNEVACYDSHIAKRVKPRPFCLNCKPGDRETIYIVKGGHAVIRSNPKDSDYQCRVCGRALFWTNRFEDLWQNMARMRVDHRDFRKQWDVCYEEKQT